MNIADLSPVIHLQLWTTGRDGVFAVYIYTASSPQLIPYLATSSQNTFQASNFKQLIQIKQANSAAPFNILAIYTTTSHPFPTVPECLPPGCTNGKPNTQNSSPTAAKSSMKSNNPSASPPHHPTPHNACPLFATSSSTAWLRRS